MLIVEVIDYLIDKLKKQEIKNVFVRNRSIPEFFFLVDENAAQDYIDDIVHNMYDFGVIEIYEGDEIKWKECQRRNGWININDFGIDLTDIRNFNTTTELTLLLKYCKDYDENDEICKILKTTKIKSKILDDIFEHLKISPSCRSYYVDFHIETFSEVCVCNNKITRMKE